MKKILLACIILTLFKLYILLCTNNTLRITQNQGTTLGFEYNRTGYINVSNYRKPVAAAYQSNAWTSLNLNYSVQVSGRLVELGQALTIMDRCKAT
jgi:hypothetical protein